MFLFRRILFFRFSMSMGTLASSRFLVRRTLSSIVRRRTRTGTLTSIFSSPRRRTLASIFLSRFTFFYISTMVMVLMPMFILCLSIWIFGLILLSSCCCFFLLLKFAHFLSLLCFSLGLGNLPLFSEFSLLFLWFFRGDEIIRHKFQLTKLIAFSCHMFSFIQNILFPNNIFLSFPENNLLHFGNDFTHFFICDASFRIPHL